MKKLFTLLATIFAVTPTLSAQSYDGANGLTTNYFSENLSPDMLSANTDQPVIRGQTPTFDDGTGGTPFFDDTGTTFNNGSVNGQQFAQPIMPAQPIIPGQQVDPFLNPQAMYGQQAPGIQAFPESMVRNLIVSVGL